MRYFALFLLLLSGQAWAVNVPPSSPQLPEHQGTWAGTDYYTTYVANAGLNLTSYTDTGTCTSAGLVTALTTGSGANVRVNCNITLSGTVDVPANTTLFSSNGSTITSTTTSDFLRLASGAKILGITFTGARPMALLTTTAQTGITIAANSFSSVSNIAIYQTATADNTSHTLIRVERNSFRSCAYAVYVTRTNRGVIAWNDMRSSTGRNIQLIGGSENQIRNNYIQDGITGINMLLSASNGSTGSMIGNTIENNEVYNTSEEAIGGDIQGNTASEIGTFDQFAITATPTGTYTSNPTLQVARTATFDPFNYYVIFYSGSLKGRYFRLQATMSTVDASNVSFKIRNDVLQSAQWNPGGNIPATGDQLAIGILAAQTKIKGNLVFTGPTSNTESSAISIYGSMFDTQVTGNIVGTYIDADPAIKLSVLCGMITSSKFASNNSTGNKTCGIVDGSVISNNTVKSGVIRLRGKSFQTLPNTILDGQVYSNTVTQNLAPDVVNDIWDQSGDTPLIGSTAPNSAAAIGTEYAISSYASSLAGDSTSFSPDDYCLNADSALLGAGTYIGAYILGYGGESLTNPPPIGARGLCQPRRAAATRRAAW